MVSEEEYIQRISKRVVRMFKHLADIVDPEDQSYLSEVMQIVRLKVGENLSSVPYPALYEMVKEAALAYAEKRRAERSGSRGKTPSVM